MSNHKGDLNVQGDLKVNETGQRALQTDATGKVESSSVTTTELGHVSGVTSSIQTQINSKVSKAGDTMTGALAMSGNKITGLGDPTSSSDAANKLYVDSVAQGLRPKEAVRASTTANITLSGLQTIDTVVLIATDRVLVKNQTDQTENGIYVAAAGAWARSTDFDSISPIDEINRSSIPVQDGSSNKGKLFVQQGSVTTIGVDNIVFVFFNSIDQLIGGDGINISGVNIFVDHDGQGLVFSSNQLALELDGSTLNKSASGLKLSDTAVTPASYGIAASVPTIVIDQQGRITSASNTAINITSSQVSDFTEATQDALGAALTDTASIDLVYTDGTNSITATVLPAGVDHDALANFVVNDHIDHSAVSISTAADSGLTGGGDLTSTRSLSVDINGTTAETVTDNADKLLIYDNSVTALKSMTRSDFLSGIAVSVTGDIPQTSFTLTNNQASVADVTGLVFANATTRSFHILAQVVRDTSGTDLFEVFTLVGIQGSASWSLASSSTGDDTGIDFTITNSGQIQYTSSNIGSHLSSICKFRAITLGL